MFKFVNIHQVKFLKLQRGQTNSIYVLFRDITYMLLLNCKWKMSWYFVTSKSVNVCICYLIIFLRYYFCVVFESDKILVDQLPVVTYRILGFLLLGVARIYSKKYEYLLIDSIRSQNETKFYFEGRRKVNINVAGMCLPESSSHRSKSNVVDVPVSESSSRKKCYSFVEGMRAQFSSISLPENFELDAFDLEIVEDDSSEWVTHYIYIYIIWSILLWLFYIFIFFWRFCVCFSDIAAIM